MQIAQTFDVELTRTFDAPIDQVWAMWSSAENVKKWWGPKGFSCPLAEVDLREGGKTFVCMSGPLFGFPKIYSTWSFTKVTPNQRIEYTFSFADKTGNKKPPMQAGIPEDGHHIVTFKDLGNGSTEMHMVEQGYTSEKMQKRSLAGLTQCIDKMARALEKNNTKDQ